MSPKLDDDDKLTTGLNSAPTAAFELSSGERYHRSDSRTQSLTSFYVMDGSGGEHERCKGSKRGPPEHAAVAASKFMKISPTNDDDENNGSGKATFASPSIVSAYTASEDSSTVKVEKTTTRSQTDESSHRALLPLADAVWSHARELAHRLSAPRHLYKNSSPASVISTTGKDLVDQVRRSATLCTRNRRQTAQALAVLHSIAPEWIQFLDSNDASVNKNRQLDITAGDQRPSLSENTTVLIKTQVNYAPIRKRLQVRREQSSVHDDAPMKSKIEVESAKSNDDRRVVSLKQPSRTLTAAAPAPAATIITPPIARYCDKYRHSLQQVKDSRTTPTPRRCEDDHQPVRDEPNQSNACTPTPVKRKQPEPIAPSTAAATRRLAATTTPKMHNEYHHRLSKRRCIGYRRRLRINPHLVWTDADYVGGQVLDIVRTDASPRGLKSLFCQMKRGQRI